MEIDRINIIYQLRGLDMTLRYQRDVLMCTFMDIPVKYFVELRGNLPLYKKDRITLLEQFVSNIDIEFLMEAKSRIFNTNDKELGEVYCSLDLVVWQLTILSARFEDKDKAVRQLCEKIGELLQMIYFLKTEMFHKDYFDFNTNELASMYLLLDRVADVRANTQSAAEKYAGWNQLEAAAEACDEKQKAELSEAERELATAGRFEVKSALNDEDIKSLYIFLGSYTNEKGPKIGTTVIDTSRITLQQFENALWYGFYTGFEENGLVEKLRFVICHFSKAYIKDSKTYRHRAAYSLNITPHQLAHYNRDDEFAAQLQKILPLVKYNKQ